MRASSAKCRALYPCMSCVALLQVVMVVKWGYPLLCATNVQAVALAMDPSSTQLDRLNQGLNLLQSIQLPFALIPVSASGMARVPKRGGEQLSFPHFL